MNRKAKTFFILTAVATATIHVINRIEYSHAMKRNTLSSPDNKYYEWRFGKIKYTKKGTGAPILLLHDLIPGSSSYEFHKIIDHLAKNHQVFSIDYLGYGLSDKPDITFTNYLYVQLINDFIKQVIKKKTDIIATGDSFPIALMTCHNDSELIRNIIGINPTNLYDLNKIPSRQTKILKLLLDTPIIGTFIYNLHTSKEAFTKTFREELFYNPDKIDEKDIDSYVECSHLTDYHSKNAYASLVGKYLNANIIHPLKEINNSIYLIGGEEKVDIHNILDNYLYYNQAAEAIYIPDTKHLPHLEKPEEVLNCLDTYLI